MWTKVLHDTRSQTLANLQLSPICNADILKLSTWLLMLVCWVFRSSAFSTYICLLFCSHYLHQGQNVLSPSSFLVRHTFQKCINRFKNHVWNFQLLKYILSPVVQPWACLKFFNAFCLLWFVFWMFGLFFFKLSPIWNTLLPMVLLVKAQLLERTSNPGELICIPFCEVSFFELYLWSLLKRGDKQNNRLV